MVCWTLVVAMILLLYTLVSMLHRLVSNLSLLWDQFFPLENSDRPSHMVRKPHVPRPPYALVVKPMGIEQIEQPHWFDCLHL